MIFYPLSTMILGGINEILIISTPKDKNLFKDLLGDGSDLGIKLEYKVQEKPEGLPQAFLIGEKFIGKSNVALILGDNLFHGDFLSEKIRNAGKNCDGASIFGYSVKDPERYGVIEFGSSGKVSKIVEKPKNPKSSIVVTGLYYYDNTVVDKTKSLEFSKRGELEISDLNNLYLNEGKLNVSIMSRGIAWLDTGTFDSLHDAGAYIRTLEKRQGLKIGSPEEASWRMGYIGKDELKNASKKYLNSEYGKYLLELSI